MTEFNHAIDRCSGQCELGKLPLAAIERQIIDWFMEWNFGPDDSVNDRIHAFDALFCGVTSALHLTGRRHVSHAILDLQSNIERRCLSNTFVGDLSVSDIMDLRVKAASGDREAMRRLDKVATEYG